MQIKFLQVELQKAVLIKIKRVYSEFTIALILPSEFIQNFQFQYFIESILAFKIYRFEFLQKQVSFLFAQT